MPTVVRRAFEVLIFVTPRIVFVTAPVLLPIVVEAVAPAIAEPIVFVVELATIFASPI